MLFLANLYFYMVFAPQNVIVLLVLITVDYWAGRLIGSSKGRKQAVFFWSAVGFNIGVLAVFKYYNFFAENASFILALFHQKYSVPYLSVLLPIGLSFYTFQSLSYLIEVYVNDYPPEGSFLQYAIYVSFFPQIIAGPIERPQHMLPQYKADLTYSYENVIAGGKQVVLGLVKKAVIADTLASIVGQVYDSPGTYSGLPVIMATYFYAFQIYYDFAGYSDIAIGVARMLGFKLMNNFDRPYFSKSISDFWKRWHISLTSWFRDYLLLGLEYLYVALGGESITKARVLVNIGIIFLISGLWHGASWTFVFWGALHGFYLILSAMTGKAREKFAEFLHLNKAPKLRSVFAGLLTFHLVVFSWIFFRSSNFSNAAKILQSLISLDCSITGISYNKLEVIIALITMIIVEIQAAHLFRDWFLQITARSGFGKYTPGMIYLFYALVIVLFGHFTVHNFIYFQF